MKKQIILTVSACMMLIMTVVSCNNNDSKTAEVKTVSKDSLIKRGGYLVSVSGCDDCHTPKKMGPMGPEPDMDLRLSGYRSQVPFPSVDSNYIKKGFIVTVPELTAWAGPWGVSYAANITSDETGIGNWTVEQFSKALRQGKWKGMDNSRSLLPPMPWQDFSHYTDEDVNAIFEFLKTTKPVKNIEPPIKPFSALTY